ncbi:hypothetical protein ACFO3U_10425 [Flavobacterium ponti]|uniref:Uncharacterized protein n=1 Tax=Flavobacterium ponti TaxID=665133 RepID=A0ABV9P478_9FLAO
MKTRFLFPNQFKTLGWILFVPSLILGILYSINNEILKSFLKIKVFAIAETQLFNYNSYFKFVENDIIDELILIGLIIGGIFIGFSKLKNEDEYISKIRYESLVWATYLNYALIIIFTLFLYGFAYLSIVFYNLFTLLLFFIIRFHYTIYKLNKANRDDE